MEWQGVDISGNRIARWINGSIRALLWLSLSLFASGLFCYFIYKSVSQLIIKNQQDRQIINQQHQELNRLEQQINKLKNQLQGNTQITYFSKKRILGIIHYLQQLPIQGGLNVAQLYFDEETNQEKLKLIGILNTSSEFEQLEQQLKQYNYRYQLIHFQTNEQHQINFSLVIDLRSISLGVQDNE
ncbi:hypothetical protein A1D22_04095 [Pasteurellaceae bacterium LFhippo2]|nr:hypothetical protein [Pasteurellaceae bacterium LFhippo2]